MTTSLRRFALNTTLALSASLAVCASASATVLSAKVTVDNGFTAYLATDNTTAGVQFLTGDNWGTAYVGSSTTLTGSQYYLHIAATDAGGLAGMLGEFSLAGTGYHFANGTTTLLTGSTYLTGNATGFSSAYTATNNLGSNGISPWGNVASFNGTTAQWIWSGNNDSNDFAYFSAVILKDAPANVPEPASLGLLGLGLLALTRFARKAK